MAEIMLLLVFCLLIAMATVLGIEERQKGRRLRNRFVSNRHENRADQELVAAIKQNPVVLETLRSAVTVQATAARSMNSGASLSIAAPLSPNSRKTAFLCKNCATGLRP